MTSLIPPNDEARTIVEKLSTNTPETINMLEALSLLTSQDFDSEQNWKKGPLKLPGIYFEEVIGAKLVENFEDFERGPDFGYPREIDFEANYLWDFKATRWRGEENRNSGAYWSKIQAKSTIDIALKRYPGLGFIFMHYSTPEREPQDNPVVTNAIKRAKDKEEVDSVASNRRAPLIIEPNVIDAYWIDGPQDYHSLLDNDMWPDNQSSPLSDRSNKPKLRFNSAEECGMLAAKAEV